jgi:hypothetical protein
MWRIGRSLFALAALLAYLLIIPSLKPLSAQGTTKVDNQRPGDEPYTPTKLEWAVLDLQATYGQNNYTGETPVLISFSDKGDGKTVLCIIQYTSDVAAAIVKNNRDTVQKVFAKYAENHRWPWLRLQFDEVVLSTH